MKGSRPPRRPWGDFLGALPILSGPWDDDFHRVFCDSCDAENCDAENCAHQTERNSPYLVAETGIHRQRPG